MDAHTAEHPLVAAALALHGITPEQAMASPEWREGRTFKVTPDSLRGDLVHVQVSPSYARVDWDVDYTGDARATLTMLMRPDGWNQTVHLRHPGLPETALAGMTGRPLAEILDVGGAESVRIASADIDRDVLSLGIETTTI